MTQTLQMFLQSLSEAIEDRVKLSKDPAKEVLTLAEFAEIMKRAIVGKQEWRPEPGYPKTLSKDSPATNSASLSQLQRGLGIPMKTFSRKVNSSAEEQQAREEGWM